MKFCRYLPSKNNREIWKLEKEIHSLILEVVKERHKATHEKDLLQRILEGAKSYDDYNITIEKFIVDNCKNLYFAGHETTAVSASWSMVMLAAYPEWQARARAEVFQICGDGLPTADMLRNMKTVCQYNNLHLLISLLGTLIKLNYNVKGSVDVM